MKDTSATVCSFRDKIVSSYNVWLRDKLWLCVPWELEDVLRGDWTNMCNSRKLSAHSPQGIASDNLEYRVISPLNKHCVWCIICIYIFYICLELGIYRRHGNVMWSVTRGVGLEWQGSEGISVGVIGMLLHWKALKIKSRLFPRCSKECFHCKSVREWG